VDKKPIDNKRNKIDHRVLWRLVIPVAVGALYYIISGSILGNKSAFLHGCIIAGASMVVFLAQYFILRIRE
jgi:hypothetical protein